MEKMERAELLRRTHEYLENLNDKLLEIAYHFLKNLSR